MSLEQRIEQRVSESFADGAGVVKAIAQTTMGSKEHEHSQDSLGELLRIRLKRKARIVLHRVVQYFKRR